VPSRTLCCLAGDERAIVGVGEASFEAAEERAEAAFARGLLAQVIGTAAFVVGQLDDGSGVQCVVELASCH
jgi:hypothetical protein